MRHAYLILAHTEFALLQKLVSALDDVRNDIFIHFDKKVENLPLIQASNAKMYVLERRIDVRWGDVSVVEAEYELFRTSREYGTYDYYHLLSGVDMPIKSQDDIYSFCTLHQGKEFIGYYQGDIRAEIDRKVKRYHLFPKNFRKESSFISSLKQIVRAISLRVQFLLNVSRNHDVNFKKGTQWVSITSAMVDLLLEKEAEVYKTYRYTFCSDEIFVQTICWNSDLRNNIFDIHDEARSSMRKIGWKDGILMDWTDGDYDEIVSSDLLFARKFNANNMRVIDMIDKKIAVNFI